MARNNIKYSILEKDGVDFAGPNEHIPDAQDIGFDKEGYESDNVEDAIVEAKDQAVALSGFVALATTSSNIGPGKFLEFTFGNPSNSHPFPVPTPCVITNLSGRLQNTDTITFTIYKKVNGSFTQIDQIEFTGSSTEYNECVDIPLECSQDLAVEVTSGSTNSPQVGIFIRREEIPT